MKFRSGLIPEKYQVTDYHFRGISGISSSVLQEDGQWDNFMPVEELQLGTYFDTFACVTFSALNCIETLFERKFGVPANFSDRFTAKKSGTTRNGNSLVAVASSIRHDGLVDENSWPFARGRDEKVTWEEYYKEIPESVVAEGLSFTDHYDVMTEWVEPTENCLMAALTEGPLQVTLTYQGTEKMGIDGVIPAVFGPENHAEKLYGYEYKKFWKLQDHYCKTIKKVAWNTKFFSALKYDLNERVFTPPSPMALKNNYLYQLVEGHGGFGLSVGDKFYVDDPALIDLSWHVRNNGDTKGKVGTLRLDEWTSLEKFNLKGERL